MEKNERKNTTNNIMVAIKKERIIEIQKVRTQELIERMKERSIQGKQVKRNLLT